MKETGVRILQYFIARDRFINVIKCSNYRLIGQFFSLLLFQMSGSVCVLFINVKYCFEFYGFWFRNCDRLQ